MIDLVPLCHFSERIGSGWTMVPGYPLTPGDYAVVMQAPGFSEAESNKTKAARWRNKLSADVRRERSA